MILIVVISTFQVEEAFKLILLDSLSLWVKNTILMGECDSILSAYMKYRHIG